MYFTGFDTVEAIKGEYRKLCMKHHPDRRGNTETMQEINQQYQQALKSINGKIMQGSDGKEHTYHYDADIEQILMDTISKLISLRMLNVDIVLIGTWIWVLGFTKPYKAELGKKGIGCCWHVKRQCWYWHQGKYHSRNSDADLSEIAAKYGYKDFFKQKQRAVIAH